MRPGLISIATTPFRIQPNTEFDRRFHLAHDAYQPNYDGCVWPQLDVLRDWSIEGNLKLLIQATGVSGRDVCRERYAGNLRIGKHAYVTILVLC